MARRPLLEVMDWLVQEAPSLDEVSEPWALSRDLGRSRAYSFSSHPND